jgi:hypothetical protein
MRQIPAIDPLTRAAIRAGSDKYGGHLYTPIYHQLFAGLREAPLKLLEIGVGGYEAERAGGLGLRMWAEYFPNARIVGLDIHPKKLALPPRIRVVQGSQTDAGLLTRLSLESGPFDIVIDDGSHLVGHTKTTFETLFPQLAPDGIYAIEDTQTSFMSPLGGRPDGKQTIFELAHKISLAMHQPEGFRDPDPSPAIEALAAMTKSVSVFRNLAVFQRGANTYPSNHGLDFGNQEVAAVYQTIVAQDAIEPTPGGALSRIDMLIWAGRLEEAGAIAAQAASRYPHDEPFLCELVRMMEWAKLDHRRAEILHLAQAA